MAMFLSHITKSSCKSGCALTQYTAAERIFQENNDVNNEKGDILRFKQGGRQKVQPPGRLLSGKTELEKFDISVNSDTVNEQTVFKGSQKFFKKFPLPVKEHHCRKTVAFAVDREKTVSGFKKQEAQLFDLFRGKLRVFQPCGGKFRHHAAVGISGGGDRSAHLQPAAGFGRISFAAGGGKLQRVLQTDTVDEFCKVMHFLRVVIGFEAIFQQLPRIVFLRGTHIQSGPLFDQKTDRFGIFFLNGTVKDRHAFRIG